MEEGYLCQVCGAECADGLGFACRCGAIYFCSEEHRASFSSSSQHHHSDLDCARLAEQLSRGGPQLDSLLLESVLLLEDKRSSSSSIGPRARDACSVLEAAGVHGNFASCCPCRGGGGGGGRGSRCRWPALPKAETEAAAATTLPSLASTLQSLQLPPLLPLSSQPEGWRDYLSARGLAGPLSSSPLAPSSSSSSAAAASAASAAAAAMILLHRPLTASLALAAAGWWRRGGGGGATGDERERRGGGDDGDDDDDEGNEGEEEQLALPFVLHVVGASIDAEVAQWPAWLELAAFLCGKEGKRKSLVVALVGPTVPVSLDGASASFSLDESDPSSSSSSSSSSSPATITIKFARGRYHEVLRSSSSSLTGVTEADAVFAPDAVSFIFFFSFERSWTKTQKKGTHPFFPSFFLFLHLDFSSKINRGSPQTSRAGERR